jgi:hypothetical protein
MHTAMQAAVLKYRSVHLPGGSWPASYPPGLSAEQGQIGRLTFGHFLVLGAFRPLPSQQARAAAWPVNMHKVMQYPLCSAVFIQTLMQYDRLRIP